VTVPVVAVRAIYSKENGQGMMFAQDDEPDPGDGPDDEKPRMKRPHLRVVK
jgi:stringent starvation protein B